MRYKVVHKTIYDYTNPVSLSYHVLRLTPRELPGQHTVEHEISGEPAPVQAGPRQDYYGNQVAFITVEGPHRKLTVSAGSVVELVPRVWPEAAATPPWESVRELCRHPGSALAREASEFVFSSPLVPTLAEVNAYAASSFGAGLPLLQAALHLTDRIHRDFKFDARATTVATSLEQLFRRRRGVCQDFAHVQIACLRSLGLPARYVSGYLETVPPPGKPKLAGADASHAWLQVWCGDAGWVDLDPTNNLLPVDRHITVAWGRDFGDVSPLRGVFIGSGSHQLRVAVDVTQMM